MTTTREAARFWAKVDFSDGCWEWTASRRSDGYAQFKVDGRTVLVHRLAYELVVGPIPEGLTLDHLCRNRACVNPDHLEPVTHRENVLRGENFSAVNAAATHCANGHPFDEANTYTYPAGKGGQTHRACRACNRAAAARYKERQKAGAR
jgi:hypothetical protein